MAVAGRQGCIKLDWMAAGTGGASPPLGVVSADRLDRPHLRQVHHPTGRQQRAFAARQPRSFTRRQPNLVAPVKMANSF